jgi:UrcA family protein
MDIGVRRAAAAALACVALSGGGVALADAAVAVGHDGRRTVTVRVDDLDQWSDAGARAVYGRLRVAARQVCGTPEGDLRRRAAVRDCHARAMSDAVSSANLPKLTALHAAQTPGRAVTAERLSAVR